MMHLPSTTPHAPPQTRASLWSTISSFGRRLISWRREIGAPLLRSHARPATRNRPDNGHNNGRDTGHNNGSATTGWWMLPPQEFCVYDIKWHGVWGVVWGVLAVWLAGCSSVRYKPPKVITPAPAKATSKPYVIERKQYTPQRHYELVQTGMASFYGGRDGCHGSLTATGERFNMFALTAAHKTLPLPCMILVENLDNHKKVVLRVNDRGPYRCNRILDVSSEAARRLGFYHKGVARIRLKTLVRESLLLPENQPGYRRRQRLRHRSQAKACSMAKRARPTVKAHYYVYVQPCATHAVDRLKKRLKDWGQIGVRRCRRGQSHLVIGPYTSIEGAQQITRALRPHHACEVVPEKTRPIAQSRLLPCQHRACGTYRSIHSQPTDHRPTLWQDIQAKRSRRPLVRQPAVLPSVLTKSVARKFVVRNPVAGKSAVARPIVRQKASRQRAQRHP